VTDAETTTKSKAKASTNGSTGDSYVLPVVGVHLPGKVVNVAFWGGLVGAVALGAIDPPLGILVGAGVLVARHGSTN
jgi:hypothetical protein